MRLCLVSPPTVTEFNKVLAESDVILRLAEHAPVGVLSLAAVLDELGHSPHIVDMNMLYYDYLRSTETGGDEIDFCSYTINHLLTLNFDVIGFGTICSSYPLTLRVAKGLREARPTITTLLGGPQASVVDIPTLECFPFIDCVVRFEAEETLPTLLTALAEDRDLNNVAGITFRRHGDVVRTVDAPVIKDLDRLPIPAYHLYPYLRRARYIPLELGRGCPYGCTFCSTNDFFRRQFRLKSPSLIVEQMSRLKRDYAIDIFDLIHDMFTVDRKKVIAFCNALLDSGETFYWNCSARTDRVDDELLAIMANAGCRGVFFGIETGSERLQKSIRKRLVLPDAMARIRFASEQGMHVAASLITGFPDETYDDFRDTVGFFASSLRYENVEPQLHILAPLAGTPLQTQYKEQLTFDDIISDMSHQGWDQNPADRAMISAYPEVFPNFYALPTIVDRPLLKDVRGFLLSAAQLFPWLLVALHQEAGHIVDVIADFQAWRAGRRVDARADDAADVPYFQTNEFKEDVIAYARSRYIEGGPHSSAFGALVTYSTCFDGLAVDNPMSDLPPVSERVKERAVVRKALSHTSVPCLASNVKLVEVDVDYRSLMECLVDGRGLADVRQGRSRLASRKIAGQWPQILQLSPASESILHLIDGVRTVAEISQEMKRLAIEIGDTPIEIACLVGLEFLRHDGLVNEVSAADAGNSTQSASG